MELVICPMTAQEGTPSCLRDHGGHVPMPPPHAVTPQGLFPQQKQFGVCIYNFLDGYLDVHCWRRTLSFTHDSEVKGAALLFILS